MKFIDTHAHLQFEKFEQDRDTVVKNNSLKLHSIINPGADLESSTNGITLAQSISNFYAAIGVHPHHVSKWSSLSISQLKSLITQPKVVAVGEIGLDNYQYQDYPQPNIKEQIDILVPQIELAIEYKKPILFHCRLAYDELYEVISKYKPITGLMHCFMGDYQTALKFVDLGLKISFAGNLTYKSNYIMQEAAKRLPNNTLVIETDSPYLTPEPLRGQRNEPLNVSLVAQKIADLKNISLQEICDITVNNSLNLFKI